MLLLMHKKTGSITIVVLIAMIAFSMILYTILTTCTYSLSLAYKREDYERNYQIIKSIHAHALTAYEKKKNKDFTLDVKVPYKNNNSYEAHSYIVDKKKKLTLHTDLKKQKKIVASLSTIISNTAI